MKKVLFVLALFVAIGVSSSTASAKVTVADNNYVTVVADVAGDINIAPEGEDDKAKSKEATATKETTAAKGEGCGEKAAKSEGCATEKSAGCGEKKSEEKK